MDYKAMLKQAIEEKTSLILSSRFLKRGSGKTTALLDLAFEHNLPVIVGNRITLELYQEILGKRILQHNDSIRESAYKKLGITKQDVEEDYNNCSEIDEKEEKEVYVYKESLWRKAYQLYSKDWKQQSLILVNHSDALRGRKCEKIYLVDESVKASIVENCFTNTDAIFIGFSL